MNGRSRPGKKAAPAQTNQRHSKSAPGAIQHIAPVPRVCLRVAEAAAALGVSEDWYALNVAPEVRAVRRGKVKLVAVAELGRWVEANAERLLEGTSR